MRIREDELIPLALEKCRPCRGMVAPLSNGESERLLRRLSGGWRMDENGYVAKEFFLKDFSEAYQFVQHICEIAEREGHHPGIYLAWGYVKIVLWTNKIGGLQRADFVLAAKIDEIS